MRLFGRHDLLLAAGLAAALIVVFSGPVARLIDYARQVESARGLQLLPALVILTVVFVLHQLWKRQEMRARTLASDLAAREATDRASDMTRLVALGQALARSLDIESIRAAAAAHLPLLVPGRGIWGLLRTGSGWTPLLVVGDSLPPEREAAACLALGLGNSDGGTSPTEICLPMLAADESVGVLGVAPDPPLTPHQRSMLAAATALLAVSVKNASLFREVRESGARDGLTGCFNRAHMLDVFEAELLRARRARTPLSVVMFDLDHFKAINDQHGHLCGDAVLASIGARMRAVLRGSDLKCRYGGEEFLVLLFDTPIAGAQHVAETLRKDIQEHPVRWNAGAIPVTASFGVTVAAEYDTDPMEVLARADEALYLAKQSGRNCVRVAGGVAPDQSEGQRLRIAGNR
jgi:diguanylate cyclase (GGDEF)-like protein